MWNLNKIKTEERTLLYDENVFKYKSYELCEESVQFEFSYTSFFSFQMILFFELYKDFRSNVKGKKITDLLLLSFDPSKFQRENKRTFISLKNEKSNDILTNLE